MTEPLMTPAELADLLCISVDTVLQRCRQRDWPHIRPGRSPRFTPEHVAQILRQTEVPVRQPKPAEEWGLKTRGRSA